MKIKPQVIVFDLDDTLFPEVEFVHSGFRAVSEYLSQQLKGTPEYFLELLERIYQEGIRGFIFDEALRRLEIYEPSPLIDEMIDVYRYHQPEICLHSDAQILLSNYQRVKTFGLITNGIARSQRQKFSALSLNRFIQHTVFCGDLGEGGQKPSTRPYQLLMDQCGSSIPPEHFLYVGDHAQKDFVGAKKLGWKTVRIVRENGLHAHVSAPKEIDAHYTIRGLSELEHAIV